ncbi:hypothetical protein [Streptomyces sp. NPDC050388]|uniref:hypothetical protein n=1 Tax=Streptomyces sp. NPDC050388 TaxID=3155781 RepID=UPI003430067A
MRIPRCARSSRLTWWTIRPTGTASLAMVFELVESAQTRWRAITGAHLVPPVRAGARFGRGQLVEPEEVAV